MMRVQKADLASLVEMNAASALLELQGQMNFSQSNYGIPVQKYNNMRPAETTTNEPSRLERLLSSLPAFSSSPSMIPVKVTSGAPKPNNQTPVIKGQNSFHKSPVFTSTPVRNQQTKKTEEKQTQTEIEYQVPQIQKFEEIVEHLSAKIKSLEKQLEENSTEAQPKTVQNRIKYEVIDNDNVYDDDDDDDYSPQNKRGGSTKRRSNRTPTTSTEAESYFSSRSEYDSEFEESMETEEASHKPMYKENPKATEEMLPIGDGYALVPERVLRTMDWRSYTAATRKLLTAVFSRKILATHSLTGKPSPAFPGKPAKKRLDPNLVHDIVQTVAQRCSVPESVVRTSITTKCADESKMFRCRTATKKRKTKKNKENSPPRGWY